MADKAGDQSRTSWPQSGFQFVVRIGNNELLFSEVSGLSADTENMEYRKGNSKNVAPIKMPGIQKYGNITMKRGLFKNDNQFSDFFQKIKMNEIRRETVTISLLDETNAVVMKWILTNAFPTKIQSTDLKADGNEVAIESLEISHEGLELSR